MGDDICIYADVLFMENLCIDYVILNISGKFLKSKIELNPMRILGGAAIGALYAVIITVIPVLSDYIILSFVLKSAVSVLMCIVSFGYKNVREFVTSVLAMYIVSFVFCGIFIAFLSLGMPVSVTEYGVFTVWGSIPVFYIVEALIAGYILMSVGIYLAKKHKNIKKRTARIYICFLEKGIWIDALCDTGNELRDPVYNLPVVIVQSEELVKIMPEKIKCLIESNSEIEISEYADAFAAEDLSVRFCIVPFNSVGCKNGIMPGFTADYVCETEEQKKKAVVCFSKLKMSPANEYKAIVPAELCIID